MKLSELNFKDNMVFVLLVFIAAFTELITENLGFDGALLPNFPMCVILSFAYLRPVPLWMVVIACMVSESFFSSTPALMSFLIIISYYAITKIVIKGGINQRNFHIIIFMLLSLVIYSTKILWLFIQDMRPQVTLILIKMLVTIIFFPLFYFSISNLLKRY